MTTTQQRTAADLVHGDLYPHPLDTDRPPVHVDYVVPTGTKKMGSDVPILAVYLLDGPKVIKCVEVPADKPINL